MEKIIYEKYTAGFGLALFLTGILNALMLLRVRTASAWPRAAPRAALTVESAIGNGQSAMRPPLREQGKR